MPEASLIITNSGIPGAVPVPGFIKTGELVLNWADSILYHKNINGDVIGINAAGLTPYTLVEELPANEGPWTSTTYPNNPANTAYVAVDKIASGATPRIKIGITGLGSNSVSVSAHDITVQVVPGTTANSVKALINNSPSASALVYFMNAPGSNGNGIVTPLPIASAVFVAVNVSNGTRAGALGQPVIVTHSDNTTTEWTAVSVEPTRWMPRTPGVIYNRDLNQWERTFVDDSILQTEVLPDQ